MIRTLFCIYAVVAFEYWSPVAETDVSDDEVDGMSMDQALNIVKTHQGVNATKVVKKAQQQDFAAKFKVQAAKVNSSSAINTEVSSGSKGYNKVLVEFNRMFYKTNHKRRARQIQCRQISRYFNNKIRSLRRQLRTQASLLSEGRSSYHANRGAFKANRWNIRKTTRDMRNNWRTCKSVEHSIKVNIRVMKKNVLALRKAKKLTKCKSFLQCGSKFTLAQESARQEFAKMPASAVHEAAQAIADHVGVDSSDVDIGEGNDSEEQWEQNEISAMSTDFDKAYKESIDGEPVNTEENPEGDLDDIELSATEEDMEDADDHDHNDKDVMSFLQLKNDQEDEQDIDEEEAKDDEVEETDGENEDAEDEMDMVDFVVDSDAEATNSTEIAESDSDDDDMSFVQEVSTGSRRRSKKKSMAYRKRKGIQSDASSAKSLKWSNRLICRPNMKVNCKGFVKSFGKMERNFRRDLWKMVHQGRVNQKTCARSQARLRRAILSYKGKVLAAARGMTNDRAQISAVSRDRRKTLSLYRRTARVASWQFSRCRRDLTTFRTNLCALNKIILESAKMLGQQRPVHCRVSPWRQVEPCTKRCGGGTMLLKRWIRRKPKNGGRPCTGYLRRTKRCNTNRCPKNCKLGPWTGWRRCSKRCGGGIKTRTRRVLRRPKAGGVSCGSRHQTARCNNFSCSKFHWGRWVSWYHRLHKRRSNWVVAPGYGLITGFHLIPERYCRATRRNRHQQTFGLHCLRGARYALVNSARGVRNNGRRFWWAKVRNFWGTMRRRGWSMCPYGYYMSALYKTHRYGDSLASLVRGWCLKPKPVRRWGHCSTIRLHKIQYRRYVGCPAGKLMVGMWRDRYGCDRNRDTLKCLKYIRCCQMAA